MPAQLVRTWQVIALLPATDMPRRTFWLNTRECAIQSCVIPVFQECMWVRVGCKTRRSKALGQS